MKGLRTSGCEWPDLAEKEGVITPPAFHKPSGADCPANPWQQKKTNEISSKSLMTTK